jgi:hypothetical protein
MQKRPALSQEENTPSSHTSSGFDPNWYSKKGSFEANLPNVYYVFWGPYRAYIKDGRQIPYGHDLMPAGHGFYYRPVFEITKEQGYLWKAFNENEVKVALCDEEHTGLTKVVEVMLFGDDQSCGKVRYIPALGCTQNGP